MYAPVSLAFVRKTEGRVSPNQISQIEFLTECLKYEAGLGRNFYLQLIKKT